MKRLILSCMLCFGLFTCWQFALSAQAVEHPACKTECSTCASVCEKTLSYCKKHGGKHTEASHVRIMQDCISTCKQSADFMSRDSGLQNQACNLCEQACTKCAESCETFKDDKTMQDCAKECRKCAEHCKKMAS